MNSCEHNEHRPHWVQFVENPKIIRTSHSAVGGLGFEAASPHLEGSRREGFLSALNPRVSLFAVEAARPVFRHVPNTESTLAPETCTPYVEANASGYYLKNVLPIVFVRTSRGELLPDNRVALKYLRENSRKFSAVLDMVAQFSHRIFEPTAFDCLRKSDPVLAGDVSQPYSAFSNAHLAMRVGCYVKTPIGVATLLGPPTNQSPPLPVRTGLMETEWHHSELFLVFDEPAGTESVTVIAADTVIAQLQFIAFAAQKLCQVEFSERELGADPAYRERSLQVGMELVEAGRDFLISETTGVKSVSVACPHCWVSVTRAAEDGVPADHVQRHEFYKGYKTLAAEYRRTGRY